ncbi:MAG: ECF transporter S component [Oscillospiraceae bacterium]|nr:ECF transporter S component [Oscillospiraceae bacterium]
MHMKKYFDTRKLVLLALLTALVVVLQMFASAIPIGPFSLNLVLIPIVVGAALIGPPAGLWLGVVFGAVVLIADPAVPLFLSFNAFATVFVIILRGALSGFLAGFAYKLPERKNITIAAIAAAAVCPLVNTGLFIAGLYIFFAPFFGDAQGVTTFVTSVLLVNFPIEVCVNLVLCPVIIRLIQHSQKTV